jgi:hypothetical protein
MSGGNDFRADLRREIFPQIIFPQIIADFKNRRFTLSMN